MSVDFPLGQPTKYKEKYCEEMIEFFSVEPFKEKIVKKVSKSGEPFEVTVEKASEMPTFEKFANKIGVHRTTLTNWAKEHPEFGDAYERCRDLFSHWLQANGVQGRIQGPFAMFIMKNALQWRDKQPDEVANISQTQVTETREVTPETIAAAIRIARKNK